MEKFEEILISKVKSLENIRTRINDKDVEGLMRNIDQHGLLQPIGVWEANGEYVIAYGNRRLAACDKLGWKKITAKILGELNTEDMLVVNASENLHRSEITVAELGRVVNLLQEAGLSNGEIAVRLAINVGQVNIASDLFNNIDEEHRKDVVFMKPGTKNKIGKIPATIYNHLFSVRRENGLNTKNFNQLIDAVKKKDLSFSQVKVVGQLIQDGATIDEAIKQTNTFVVRRINIAINREVEKKIMEAHGLKLTGELFDAIISGEMSGTKNLVYRKKI